MSTNNLLHPHREYGEEESDDNATKNGEEAFDVEDDAEEDVLD